MPLRLVTLQDVGLPNNSSDRQIRRFAQAQQVIVLTGNRRMKGADSLEQTIREENTPVSLPVITIGNLNQLDERGYRERCAKRLVEVILDIDNYRGAGRIYIP